MIGEASMNDEKRIEILKNNGAAPRYTSYPPANFFKPSKEVGTDVKKWIESIERTNVFGAPEVSFYIHIPFCPVRCLFCGCNTEIGRNKPYKERYFTALIKELDHLLPLVDSSRPLTQIHFGGGTPNAVPFGYLDEIISRIFGHFGLTDRKSHDVEVAIECDPSLLRKTAAQELADIGFNRASIGVQDFNQEVLGFVHRQIPLRSISQHIQEFRDAGFFSVNLDLICGLPGQNRETFADTLQKTIEARPDRIACFNYAHIPNILGHQKQLDKHPFASQDERLMMNVDVHREFTEAGYVAVGMDHYALPSDELSKSLDTNTLGRNFQGYAPAKRMGQVYAIGASGISQWESGFYANIKDSEVYMQSMEDTGIPFEREYHLTDRERALRWLIESVMCKDGFEWNDWLAYPGLEKQIEVLREELQPAITDLEERDLIKRTDSGFKLTERGVWLQRVVAAGLDPLMKNGTEKTFSKVL